MLIYYLEKHCLYRFHIFSDTFYYDKIENKQSSHKKILKKKATKLPIFILLYKGLIQPITLKIDSPIEKKEIVNIPPTVKEGISFLYSPSL